MIMLYDNILNTIRLLYNKSITSEKRYCDCYFCIVLYCIVLHYIVLYCIVLYCIMRPYTDGPIGLLSYRHSSGVVQNSHSALAE